jgi:hypothetical protein
MPLHPAWVKNISRRVLSAALEKDIGKRTVVGDKERCREGPGDQGCGKYENSPDPFHILLDARNAKWLRRREECTGCM